MSKNFELMQEAGIKLESPAPEESKRERTATSLRGTSGERIETHFDLNDKFTREETLKLVQSVFLMGGDEAPRAVVFAGIDPGNGCSSICAHAADLLANQRIGSVCVVDANLRTPALPEM